MEKKPPWILPIIVLTQFAGTSLWFASNAVLSDLQKQWNLPASLLGSMTSAVQLGFILGTLIFAVFAIADRFSPRNIFFICSVFGAFSNLCVYWFASGLTSLLIFRFITGVFLAGIYPIGMKIAAGWYQEGLGKALGFLVGALVLGTAFPHFLKATNQAVEWKVIIISISGLSLLGGILMWIFVPDGPFLAKGTKFNYKAMSIIFESKGVRSASFGYFGHMWELYALWAFIPVILKIYVEKNGLVTLNISLWSFIIIAVGSLGCIVGGFLSQRFGSATIAFIQLFASGLCCLISPFLFSLPKEAFLGVLVFWGIVVVGDSPQFSTLVAKTAPKELVGSALTIVNCIGFSVTIISIQLLTSLSNYIDSKIIFIFLLIGPVIGLISLWSSLEGRQNKAINKV
ncbi:MAG: putative MFS family arabinose efflux permease [bacterium]|jgi:predicted MFS family arabinose efflux permease